MVEWVSSSALTLLRSDKCWHACSFLILASGLVLGIYDLYLQAPSPQLKILQAESNRSNSSIVNQEDEKLHRSADYIHWDFFGVPEKLSAELDIETLPETELDLKLIATFTSDREFSSIVIRDSKGESKRVFLGGAIMDGVNIHTIKKTQAVINRGSVLETLNLYNFDVQERGRNPNRPSYRKEIPEPMEVISSRRKVRTGYQNNVDEQRVNRKKRRERYLTTLNSPAPSTTE